MGTNPSTASRLLRTLAARGLVEQAEPGGRYRLGLRLLELADGVMARLDVRDVARPRLEALALQTGETATLSVPGEDAAVTVDFVPSRAAVASLARIGRPSVPHATAAGKVLLAFGPLELEALGPGPLRAYTPRTCTDPAILRKELDGVRSRGWARAVGEREPDLAALAAPVPGRHGELAAILGVQGPAARLDGEREPAILEPLLAAAAAIARKLGGRDPAEGGRSAG